MNRNPADISIEKQGAVEQMLTSHLQLNPKHSSLRAGSTKDVQGPWLLLTAKDADLTGSAFCHL
jgi:hypothetical protein